MPYQNPGAAFSQGIESFMAEQSARKRQQMLDDLAQKREDRNLQTELEHAQQQREVLKQNQREWQDQQEQRKITNAQDAEDRALKLEDRKIVQEDKDFAKLEGDLVPGMDRVDALDAKSQALLRKRSPNSIQMRPQPPKMDEQGPQQPAAMYMGRGAERQAAQFLNQLDPNDPNRAALQAELAGFKGYEGQQPLYTHDSVKGKYYESATGREVTSLPKNAVLRTNDVPNQGSSSSGVDVSDMSSRAVDMAARLYVRTGSLPPLGNGAAAASLRKVILERASMYDDKTDTFSGAGSIPDIASASSDFKSNQAALTQLTKNQRAISSFSNAAELNKNLLEDMLEDLPDTGNAWLNKPWRAFQTAAGNEKMAQFNTYRQSLQAEFSRILNNPNLTGVVSNQAQNEMRNILNPDAPVAAIRASLQALTLEAGNRKTAMAEEIASVRGQIKGGTSVTPDPTTTTSAPRRPKKTVSEYMKLYGGGR